MFDKEVSTYIWSCRVCLTSKHEKYNFSQVKPATTTTISLYRSQLHYDISRDASQMAPYPICSEILLTRALVKNSVLQYVGDTFGMHAMPLPHQRENSPQARSTQEHVFPPSLFAFGTQLPHLTFSIWPLPRGETARE